jgi:hypothetical protein
MRQGLFREYLHMSSRSTRQPSTIIHFFSSPDKAGAKYVTLELVDEVIVVSKRNVWSPEGQKNHDLSGVNAER